MGLILVRKLFEVRLLHEYYLSTLEGGSFFGLPQAEQETLLKDRLFYGQYPLMKELSISPTLECSGKLRANKLFFARSALGFIVGIEVEAEKVDDGAGGLKEIYRPKRPVEPGLKLEFSVNNFNPYSGTITNSRFRNSTLARNFFSTRDPDNLKFPPSLSQPVPEFLSGKTYEMGEMARIGGIIREAIKATNSNDPSDWVDAGISGLANESDRMLLPKAFAYTFYRDDVTSAEFVLKDQDGQEVKSLTFNGDGAIRNVHLNFRTKTFGAGGTAEEIPDGFYILEVAGAGNYQETLPVYLNDSLYKQANWGVIEINFQPGRPEFELFTPQGNLITEKLSDGTFTPAHPRFEVRLRARRTIWRYKSKLGKTLKKDVMDVTILTETGGNLVASVPRPLSASPITFQALDQLNQQQEVFLPMPEAGSLREETGRFYSDIYISNVKDIIKVE